MLVIGGLTVDGLAYRERKLASRRPGTCGAVSPCCWSGNRPVRASAKFTYLAVVVISAGSTARQPRCWQITEILNRRARFCSPASPSSWPQYRMFFWLLSLADELPALVLGLDHRRRRYGCLRRVPRCARRAMPSLLTPQPLLMFGRSPHLAPRRTADAHPAQPQTPAGSLHGRRRRLPASRRRLAQRHRHSRRE